MNGGLKKVAVFIWHHTPLSNLMIMHGSVGCLFPVDEIMEEVENRCRNFSDAMIGVHIRRTDNLASIRQSPIELFYQKLDEKIKEDGKVAIYLATDSEEVKREMKERYGDRIFCSGKRQTVDLWRE